MALDRTRSCTRARLSGLSARGLRTTASTHGFNTVVRQMQTAEGRSPDGNGAL